MSNTRNHLPVATLRIVAAGAAAVCLASPGPVSAAQEMPGFRKGLWEFTRTVEGTAGKKDTMATKKCASPSEDMKKQNEMLTKAGCTFSPVTASGNAYTFSSQCNVQGAVAQSKSVLTAEGDSAYKVEVESQGTGGKTRELLVARRIGDC
jgi:hypothetical protein